MNVSDAYRQALEKLNNAGIKDAAFDLQLIMEDVFEIDRYTRLSFPDKELDDNKIPAFESYVNRRCERIPLQHILGYQDFMGLRFNVNEHTLIPRFDTEVLVEETLKYVHDGMSVLDMCTGSGCIITSILYYSNGCRGVGVDISKEALEVARCNSSRILEKRDDISIDYVNSDLFSNLPDKYQEYKFDIIVSNPPYICTDVINTLEKEVRDYDPYIALNGGSDGLDFYRRIVNECNDYLLKGGVLLFEIGYDEGEDVKNLMENNGFIDVQVINDLQGLQRVVVGTKSCLIN